MFKILNSNIVVNFAVANENGNNFITGLETSDANISFKNPIPFLPNQEIKIRLNLKLESTIIDDKSLDEPITSYVWTKNDTFNEFYARYSSNKGFWGGLQLIDGEDKPKPELIEYTNEQWSIVWNLWKLGEWNLYIKAIQMMQPNSFGVEIGSNVGISTAIFGIEMLKINSVLYTIDNYSEYGGLENSKIHRENMIKCGLGNVVTQIIANSHDMMWHFNVEPNFLFVDGAHDYESVLADMNFWIPKVKHNSPILFHDWDLIDVKKAINKWIESNPNIVKKIGNNDKCVLFIKL